MYSLLLMKHLLMRFLQKKTHFYVSFLFASPQFSDVKSLFLFMQMQQ
jgi:hypothetical protein